MLDSSAGLIYARRPSAWLRTLHLTCCLRTGNSPVGLGGWRDEPRQESSLAASTFVRPESVREIHRSRSSEQRSPAAGRNDLRSTRFRSQRRSIHAETDPYQERPSGTSATDRLLNSGIASGFLAYMSRHDDPPRATSELDGIPGKLGRSVSRRVKARIPRAHLKRFVCERQRFGIAQEERKAGIFGPLLESPARRTNRFPPPGSSAGGSRYSTVTPVPHPISNTTSSGTNRAMARPRRVSPSPPGRIPAEAKGWSESCSNKLWQCSDVIPGHLSSRSCSIWAIFPVASCSGMKTIPQIGHRGS